MNGVKQGYGKFTWADGNWYEGNFEENIIQGKGKRIALRIGES